jgi:hypothetical protein
MKCGIIKSLRKRHTTEAAMTTTYYHVAPADYDGGDLLSFEELEARGYNIEWKYESDLFDPFDTDAVCLFETESEARDFIADFLPDGILLRVVIPDDADDVRMVRVAEGYPAVLRKIPARYIEVVQ